MGSRFGGIGGLGHRVFDEDDVPLDDRPCRVAERDARRLRAGRPRSYAAAVISSERPMMAKLSCSCSSVMQSGGLVKRLFQLTNAYIPCSRRNAASFCISGLVPLKGAIGSFVSRLRTSSRTPKRPIERTSPTEGCLAFMSACN